MTSGTMIISLLLLAILYNGTAALNEYEIVERSLLSTLGLSRKPKVDGDVKIPPAMMELYNLMKKEKFSSTATSFPLPGVHTMSANTARTYINKGSPPNNVKSQRYRLQFDINSLPEREKVKSAEVRLTIPYNTSLFNGELIHVVVHDIVKPGIRGLSKPILRLLDSKSLNLSKDDYSEVISFDVTPAILRLLENNFKENHGTLIQCITTAGSTTRLVHLFDLDTPDKAVLMVYTDDETNKKNELTDSVRRSKRSADGGGDKKTRVAATASPRRKRKERKLCQLHSLYVNFADIDFSDWIKAPEGFDLFYCQGECAFPLSEHMNASNHAVVQNLLNSQHPAVVPRACCVPTKYETITLLYVDDDNRMQMKNYREMTATECGCR